MPEEFRVSWDESIVAETMQEAAEIALRQLRTDPSVAIFAVQPKDPSYIGTSIDLRTAPTLEDKRVLLYDGRFDGPDYSHPYWPTPGDPWTCVVCGTNTEGRDRRGGFDDRGSPHRKLDNGFYASVLTVGPHAGESVMTCPKCSSVNNHQTIQPGPTGTGPGRTWRMGDPGGRTVTVCRACGHTS